MYRLPNTNPINHIHELRLAPSCPPNNSPDCVISRVNHPMIEFSPHHLARVRREFGMAKGKGHEIWQSRPTINLLADLFLSLSLERTQPQREFKYDVAVLRRSARSR